MSEVSKFNEFLRAIERYELSGEEIKATSHTSAVSVRWDEISKVMLETSELADTAN